MAQIECHGLQKEGQLVVQPEQTAIDGTADSRQEPDAAPAFPGVPCSACAPPQEERDEQ